MKYYLKQLKEEWHWNIQGWRDAIKRTRCWWFHSWQWGEKVPWFSTYGRAYRYCVQCNEYFGEVG